ncbi:hypothetical protein H0A71_15105 [Alcaligenaceae bacterium]|nr:hypothetical protein [Alcaligenaceae bacterium]
MESHVISYLESQRRGAQWELFLRSLAVSLQNWAPSDTLRKLMRDAGVHTGQDLVLPTCETLIDLEAAANEHWTRMGWGFVKIQEQHDCISITHDYAPLEAVFGREAMEWVGSFLEGIYQQWFVFLGAGDGLQVKQVGVSDTGALNYKFGR